MTRLSLPTRDASFWAPRNRQSQEYDTTRWHSSPETLPHWNMQGHDVQNGSAEKRVCRVWQQGLLLSLASSLLASFAGKHYANLRRARAGTPSTSHGFSLVVLPVTRLSSTFYSHMGPCWRTNHDATIAALTDTIMKILHTIKFHMSVQ